jgi:hypothetical protein
MRVNNFHCSFGIGFREGVAARYGLTHYDDPPVTEPLLLVGVYNDRHRNMVRKHASELIIYWCGTDAQRLAESQRFMESKNMPELQNFWLMMFKSRKHVYHIAPSHWIADDLNGLGLRNVFEVPALLKNHSDITPAPLGDCVYMYNPGNKIYNGGIYEEIKSRVPYEFIESNIITFKRAELIEAYKRCFVGFRFTEHDGLSETVAEMGLMGRPVVHNGDLPNCVKYNSVEDVIKYLDELYNARKSFVYNELAEEVKNYLTIDFDWLDTDNYK